MRAIGIIIYKCSHAMAAAAIDGREKHHDSRPGHALARRMSRALAARIAIAWRRIRRRLANAATRFAIFCAA